MSSVEFFEINCDWCENHIDTVEDLESFDHNLLNDGGMVDVEIKGGYYEHVCISCSEDIYACEDCGMISHYEEMFSCIDRDRCEDCSSDYHTELRSQDPDHFSLRTCIECNWELRASIKDGATRPTVSLL